ncbi:Sts1p [Saccharomyces eubayanus]|uniref:Sts1p n=1 Tax=Saccharomyces eubayanus TaxID=1080349 RepID=UPI0006C2341B|nr:STS1-like protein [Saccharomyces eubayanus]KOG98899.1 STS1-like protein [Saccharomyces eubayanus]
MRRTRKSYLKIPLAYISHLKGSKVSAKKAANTRQYSIMMGFAWGFKPAGKVPQDTAGSQSSGHMVVANSVGKQKRRYSNEEQQEEPSRNKSMTKFGGVSKRRPHPSSLIRGQPLPLQRGMELMSKEQLQQLLVDLMTKHPEIQQSVHTRITGLDFSIQKCLDVLKQKSEAVYQSIPYNRSYESNKLDDYAFVRMKPQILEFLNCLVDFILDNIPPRLENLHASLKFLDICTELVIKLPRFELASNNYYYDKCIEQLSHVWCTLIEHVARDRLILLADNSSVWKTHMTRLQIYNEQSNGLLERPLQLFKSLDMGASPASPSSSSSSSFQETIIYHHDTMTNENNNSGNTNDSPFN